MDSEDECDEPQGRPAANFSERRRAQKAIFDAWIRSDAGQEALNKTRGPENRQTTDEELSIRELLAGQGTQIIKNPRDYQTELFERAKKENTIAVLDTGSGKTLIAVMLLRATIDAELEARASQKVPRVSFFLVASVSLAHQQFSVLETNLDHKVARVCGADFADTWEKPKWLKLFAENKVIVCTADILLHCLSRSFVSMKQINLLIFDEAHHAKKNHAYARILKDFYFSTNITDRPRIFGMTASPIDAKTDVTQAASELEAILDSKIATTLDMSLTEAVKKPTEQVLHYAALPLHPSKSGLLQAVKAKFGHIKIFHRFIDNWESIARELGNWCADRYLIDKISDKRQRKYEVVIEKDFNARCNRKDPRELDSSLTELRSAVQFINEEGSKLATPLDGPSSVSSKVMEMRHFLRWQFERETTHRCIVFVDKRETTRLLNFLFQKIGTSHMRSAVLVGGNNGDDEDSFSFRQQVISLLKFRKGEINCLFATSVAEEGLDVPDCNLVIRFNVAQTMIQYVQSRGRARKQNSKFLHMIEHGNSIHQDQIKDQQWQELAMRRFCQALPEDRRLLGNEDTLEALLFHDKAMPAHIEPLTGATLNYGNALVYLANFVSSLHIQTGELQHPTYNVVSRGSKFVCEVLLPGNGPQPLRSAIGRICKKKTVAKRSAAFEACKELRKLGLLDEYFLSTFQKKLPVLRNALLAVNMDKSTRYQMRTKPSVWEQTTGPLPVELWVTVIDFPNGLDREHHPLAILTRTQLPNFPSFPIFLNDLRESSVASRAFPEPFSVDESVLHQLSAFTFKVFRDVFSKKYEATPSKLSYWLAPAAVSAAQSSTSKSWDAIDWSTLDLIVDKGEQKWQPSLPDSFLLDRFLVDEGDGSRKFYSLAIEGNLKPSDPVPEDAAKYKFNKNILEYSVSTWGVKRKEALQNLDQPVIVAEKVLTRRNLLAKPDPKEISLKTRAYLCPEPLKISTLPTRVAASCFVFPGIIHRFESYMIAMEACSTVGVQCKPRVALAAMTKDSDSTGEHDNPYRINFQSGMGENYERLEFIGDTFLKTATTISTFIQNPNDNEFDFHVKRMRLLCNSTLANVAKELKLYEYIRTRAFTRRVWYPEGLRLLEGKGAGKLDPNAQEGHSLNEKTIADVSEALIGAAFVSHDKPGEKWHEDQWENAVRAVSKLTTRLDGATSDIAGHTMTSWNEYRTAYTKPDYQTGEATASHWDLVEKVKLEHPYRFQYPRLLRSAFIHPSQPFIYEEIPNYQRLEFLGDALLDMASITHIFYRFPNKDPQWLTEHKMAMVSNKFLGAVCVNIGFHKHLRHSSAIVERQITEYVAELEEAKLTAGVSRDYWTTISDPPKCLPDIVESFVGAMFIDSDFDYNEVQKFFDKHIKWYFEDMSIYDTYANNHPCTHLHKLLDVTYGCQDYTVMAKELPPEDGVDKERQDIVAVVMIHNKIVAHSKGKSGRYAKIRVANDAIQLLEGLAPFEFRSRFGCACSKHDEQSVPSANGSINA